MNAFARRSLIQFILDQSLVRLVHRAKLVLLFVVVVLVVVTAAAAAAAIAMAACEGVDRAGEKEVIQSVVAHEFACLLVHSGTRSNRLWRDPVACSSGILNRALGCLGSGWFCVSRES